MTTRVHYEPPWPGAVAPKYDGCRHEEWGPTADWVTSSPLGLVFACTRCGHRRSGLGLAMDIDDIEEAA